MAENGALDPWSLNLRFWGAPFLSPEAPTLNRGVPSDGLLRYALSILKT